MTNSTTFHGLTIVHPSFTVSRSQIATLLIHETNQYTSKHDNRTRAERAKDAAAYAKRLMGDTVILEDVNNCIQIQRIFFNDLVQY